MTTTHFFNSFVNLTSEVMFLGETPPNAGDFYAILSSSSTITRTDSLSSVVATELSGTNGYSRKLLTFSSGTYDTVNEKYNIDDLAFSVTANSSGSIIFQTVVILANANSIIGDTSGKLVLYTQYPSPITILASQTRDFLISLSSSSLTI